MCGSPSTLSPPFPSTSSSSHSSFTSCTSSCTSSTTLRAVASLCTPPKGVWTLLTTPTSSQIAPDSRLVALRPVHLRVCNEVRLKTLRSDSVANHAGPRGPCEKSVPKMVCDVSHKRFCRGLPSALIAAVAGVCAFLPWMAFSCPSRRTS